MASGDEQVQVNFRMRRRDRDRLHALAARKQYPVSALIRDAVNLLLDREGA